MSRGFPPSVLTARAQTSPAAQPVTPDPVARSIRFPLETWGDDEDLGLHAVVVPDGWNGRLVLWNEGAADMLYDPVLLGDPPAVDRTSTDPELFVADHVARLLRDGAWRPRHFAAPLPSEALAAFPGDYRGPHPGSKPVALCAPDAPVFSGEMAERLLSAGYALAQTWGTRASMRTMDQWRTRREFSTRLLRHFHATIAVPEHTIAIGRSLGAVVSAKLLVESPELVSGAISLGQHPIAYSEVLVPSFAALALFHHFFPWPPHWGSPLHPRGERACPSSLGETIPFVMARAADPANFAKLEMIRLVFSKHVTKEGFHGSPLSSLGVLGFLPNYIWAIEALMGGWIVDFDVDFTKALTRDEAAYVEGLDPSLDVAAILADLDASCRARRADPDARRRLEQYFDVNVEQLSRPLLLHNASHADAEALEIAHVQETRVRRAGKRHLCEQLYVSRPSGHMAATLEQIVDTIRAMDAWVTTGAAPDWDDPAVLPPAHGWDRSFAPARPWWR